MTIGLFSPSVALTFDRTDAGVVSITNQEAGLFPGVVAELTGMLNGGRTGSVGMSSTVATTAKVLAGVAVANRTAFTKTFPLIGEARG